MFPQLYLAKALIRERRDQAEATRVIREALGLRPRTAPFYARAVHRLGARLTQWGDALQHQYAEPEPETCC